MSKKNGTFHLSVSPFSGEPEFVNFFFKSVSDLAELNGWSEDQALAFCRSRLEGAALKFYVSSEAAQNATELDQLQLIFASFFRPQSKQQAILELQSIKLLPQETIVSLAQRIDTLIKRAHPEIIDSIALDSVKLPVFLNAIPQTFKFKILENSIDIYTQAVAKAQLLQDLQVQSCSFSTAPTNPMIDSLSQAVNHIKQNVADLSSKIDNNNKVTKKQESNLKSFSKPNTSRANFKSRNQLVCQFCNKRFHALSSCFKFKAMLNDNNIDPHAYKNNGYSRGNTSRRPSFGRSRNFRSRGRSFYPSRNSNYQNDSSQNFNVDAPSFEPSNNNYNRQNHFLDNTNPN